MIATAITITPAAAAVMAVLIGMSVGAGAALYGLSGAIRDLERQRSSLHARVSHLRAALREAGDYPSHAVHVAAEALNDDDDAAGVTR